MAAEICPQAFEICPQPKYRKWQLLRFTIQFHRNPKCNFQFWSYGHVSHNLKYLLPILCELWQRWERAKWSWSWRKLTNFNMQLSHNVGWFEAWMPIEAARDPNVTYDVQISTSTFTGVELCECRAIRYFGWGQISKAWGQISAALYNYASILNLSCFSRTFRKF